MCRRLSMPQNFINSFLIFPSIIILFFLSGIVSPSLGNIYFSLILVVVLIFLSYLLSRGIKVGSQSLFLVLMYLIFITLLNYVSVSYIKPQVFFLFLCVLYVLFYTASYRCDYLFDSKVLGVEYGALIKFIFISFLLVNLSLALLGLRFDHMGRFIGIASSPTVLAVLLGYCLIFLYWVEKRPSVLLVFSYAIVVYLHIKTGTRINLVFIGLYPFVIFFYKNTSSKVRLTFIVSFIVILNLMYPIYDYLIGLSGEGLLANERYGDGRDASFGLRFNIFNLLIDEFLTSFSNLQVLFGAGSEFSRQYVLEYYSLDILPHNDFLRLSLDFGVLFLFGYMYVLIRLSQKNTVAFLAVLLYLISFYHNMVYSFPLMLFLLFFSFFESGDLTTKKNVQR